MRGNPARKSVPPGLYSAQERARRDSTIWTTVQGVLAPLQFVVFLISLALVLRYLWSGEGYQLATLSIVLKTLVLYVIIIATIGLSLGVFSRDMFSIVVLMSMTNSLIAPSALRWLYRSRTATTRWHRAFWNGPSSSRPSIFPTLKRTWRN